MMKLPNNTGVFAAAPDLLVALEEMHAQFKADADYATDDKEVIEQAETVISQATAP